MNKSKVLDFSRRIIVSQIVKDILRYKKSGTVLDIGAGSGRNSLYLAQKGFAVTALDQDQKALSKLRKLARTKKSKVNIKNIEFANFKNNESYDVIVAINFLHFFKLPQVRKHILRIKNMTRAGGLNVVGVHTNKNKKGSRPYLFKANELKKFYAGWKILKYNEKLGLPYRTVLGAKPVQKHRAILIAQKN